MDRFKDVLKNKNFFFLWLGQTVSNFGDRLNQMALVALVYQRNPGSEVALAKLISFTIIPVFLIGPIAGVWVDRLNRKNVMIISDVLRGALVLSIPFFIFMKQIIPVYLVIFLTFSISRFFIPSKMAIIPDIVSKDKLLVANTLQDTTHIIGNVVGLVAAGVIVNIRYVGAIGGFYIDALTFFVSASLIAMMARQKFDHSVREDLDVTREALYHSLRSGAGQAFGNSFRRSFFGEIREGIKCLMKYTDMRFIMYIFFLLMAGLGTISCVIIVFIQDAFGTSTRDIGFLGTFLAVGLLLGVLLYGRLGHKTARKAAIYLSFIMTGIFITLFAIFVRQWPNLFLGGVLSGLIGMAVSPIMVSTNTLTHETIPEDVRGRIFSSLEMVIHLAFLVFMFVAAYAANCIDRFWIIVATGVIFSLCGMAGILLEKRRSAISF